VYSAWNKQRELRSGWGCFYKWTRAAATVDVWCAAAALELTDSITFLPHTIAVATTEG
jgi:hypothetical protein